MRKLSALTLLACLATAVPAFAQDTSVDKSASGLNLTAGRPWYSTLFGQAPIQMPKANLANTDRIQSLLRDGKLYLSLNDAIALDLENNLDIAIQRFNLPIADTDVLRAKSGTAPRGVSTGIVSGTPGGGGATSGTGGASGGGAGGTSTGAGGAGAGAGGIVTSTVGGGPGVPQLDPSLSTNLSISDSSSPESSTVLTGTNTLTGHTGTANFSYTQGFLPGTSLSIGYTNNRTSNDSLRNTFNPTLSSGLSLSISQPLLQGFGVRLNERNLVIAKNNREIADIAFRQQVEASVAQVEDIYWDLVNAHETLAVAQEAVSLAQKVLDDTQRQVEVGTMAPLAVTQAKATLATDQENLIVAQTNYEYEELLMKNAVTKNLSDPILAVADVVPSDKVTLAENEPVQPVEDLIKQALQYRPELAENRINLSNDQISLDASKNELKPSVNLVGSYSASSQAGVLLDPCPAPPAVQPAGCTSPSSVNGFIGGYGTTVSSVFQGNYPTYAIGLNAQITIRNRSAQADVVRSELSLAQAQVQNQQTINNIIITVRQAAFTVQQNRAQVQAAQQAVQFNRETLDADNKKLSLGATTLTQVLTDQNALTQAESSLIQAETAYAENKVNLERLTGTTLVNNRISVVDAENGKVTQMPQVHQ